MSRSLAIAATMSLFGLLAGCAGDGMREVEYTQSRGISADIAATRNSGPSSLTPGETVRGEPRGAIPWQLDDRH